MIDKTNQFETSDQIHQKSFQSLKNVKLSNYKCCSKNFQRNRLIFQSH